ncbi:MAG: hypothetical protein COB50_04765, partial [Thiotrichales bacterium]
KINWGSLSSKNNVKGLKSVTLRNKEKKLSLVDYKLNHNIENDKLTIVVNAVLAEDKILLLWIKEDGKEHLYQATNNMQLPEGIDSQHSDSRLCIVQKDVFKQHCKVGHANKINWESPDDKPGMISVILKNGDTEQDLSLQQYKSNIGLKHNQVLLAFIENKNNGHMMNNGHLYRADINEALIKNGVCYPTNYRLPGALSGNVNITYYVVGRHRFNRYCETTDSNFYQLLYTNSTAFLMAYSMALLIGSGVKAASSSIATYVTLIMFIAFAYFLSRMATEIYLKMKYPQWDGENNAAYEIRIGKEYKSSSKLVRYLPRLIAATIAVFSLMNHQLFSMNLMMMALPWLALTVAVGYLMYSMFKLSGFATPEIPGLKAIAKKALLAAASISFMFFVMQASILTVVLMTALSLFIFPLFTPLIYKKTRAKTLESMGQAWKNIKKPFGELLKTLGEMFSKMGKDIASMYEVTYKKTAIGTGLTLLTAVIGLAVSGSVIPAIALGALFLLYEVAKNYKAVFNSTMGKALMAGGAVLGIGALMAAQLIFFVPFIIALVVATPLLAARFAPNNDKVKSRGNTVANRLNSYSTVDLIGAPVVDNNADHAPVVDENNDS